MRSGNWVHDCCSCESLAISSVGSWACADLVLCSSISSAPAVQHNKTSAADPGNLSAPPMAIGSYFTMLKLSPASGYMSQANLAFIIILGGSLLPTTAIVLLLPNNLPRDPVCLPPILSPNRQVFRFSNHTGTVTLCLSLALSRREPPRPDGSNIPDSRLATLSFGTIWGGLVS